MNVQEHAGDRVVICWEPIPVAGGDMMKRWFGGGVAVFLWVTRFGSTGCGMIRKGCLAPHSAMLCGGMVYDDNTFWADECDSVASK